MRLSVTLFNLDFSEIHRIDNTSIVFGKTHRYFRFKYRSVFVSAHKSLLKLDFHIWDRTFLFCLYKNYVELDTSIFFIMLFVYVKTICESRGIILSILVYLLLFTLFSLELIFFDVSLLQNID